MKIPDGPRNQWDRGLPLVAKSTDVSLAAVAKQDIVTAKTGTDHLAIADKWPTVTAAQPDEMRLSIQERALHHYEQSAKSMDGLERVRVKKISDLKSRLYDDKTKRWIVILRSSDPTIWNTDTSRGPDDFDEPLSRTPPRVRYVRVRRSLTESVIIPISQAELGKAIIRDRFGSQGAKQAIGESMPLGVIDFRQTSRNPSVAIHLFISPDGSRRFGGWGFGGNANLRYTPVDFIWYKAQLQRSPIEIAITTQPLKLPDRRFLLE